MAFPLPSLLGSIEELLHEVQWLDGLILVTDSQRTSFVSFSQLEPVLGRLRARPNGDEVAERLCMSLLETQGKAGSKPVLVLQNNGRYWLGMMAPLDPNPHRHQTINHLHRCFELNHH